MVSLVKCVAVAGIQLNTTISLMFFYGFTFRSPTLPRVKTVTVVNLSQRGSLVDFRHLPNLLSFDRLAVNLCSTPTNLTTVNRLVRRAECVAAIICPKLSPL